MLEDGALLGITASDALPPFVGHSPPRAAEIFRAARR
jgi:hypothetical protein